MVAWQSGGPIVAQVASGDFARRSRVREEEERRKKKKKRKQNKEKPRKRRKWENSKKLRNILKIILGLKEHARGSK